MPRLVATRLGAVGSGRARDPRYEGVPTATQDWLRSVEAFDGAPLETAVFNAMRDFANWRIPFGGACALLTGPRTLAGALTPMVGAQFVGVNLIEADYNRRRLQLDGVIKLFYNEQAPAPGVAQNSQHVLVSTSQAFNPGATGRMIHLGNPFMTFVSPNIVRASTTSSAPFQDVNTAVSGTLGAGCHGIFRTNSTDHVMVTENVVGAPFARASASPGVFAAFYGAVNNGTLPIAMPVNVASVGPYIDPTEFRNRVDTVVAAILAVVP